jgi:hypothetical protein
MLFYIAVFAIAFAEPEDLTYPWSYAAVMGVVQAIILKFMTDTDLMGALLGGAATFAYMGVVLWWLSKQTRYSFFWFVALLLAVLPAIGPRLLARA